MPLIPARGRQRQDLCEFEEQLGLHGKFRTTIAVKKDTVSKKTKRKAVCSLNLNVECGGKLEMKTGRTFCLPLNRKHQSV